jgi:hypothetical protein
MPVGTQKQRGRPKTARQPKPEKAKKRCRNCDAPFVPTREWQEFHSPACKKEFWRHGGISIRRILPTLLAEVEKRLVDFDVRISQIEGALRPDKVNVPF